ncbi:MAG TPA: efflux RND transporter periplasmic adaptor subunit [Anaeromyxobacteraceae bacterium]|nr:efflux RND transporter periplasmic adaptor subunit [Anaeromyxobacteraceae bacterium]
MNRADRASPALLAAIGTALLLAVLPGCGNPAHAAPVAGEALVPVRTVPVQAGPVERPVRAAGLVATKDQWDLSFKVGGVLASLDVREGQRVRKGQVLARLDPTELAAGLRQAREGLEKARRDAARTTRLAAAEVAPRLAAEDARTAEAVAEAQAAAAEFNLRQATLRAPDDGWVDQRLAEPGEVVAPGRPIVHLSGQGRGFVVRAPLADRDALGLLPGARAQVTLDAAPDRPLAGRVGEIARAAGRGTGTFQVEIALDPAPGQPLLSGLTAKIEIARTVPVAGAVPLGAVVDGDGDRGAVFTVDGGVARRVPVRIAFLQGDRAVLAEGVQNGDRVVSEGAPRLAEGTRVKVVE